jgi:hypothetical protein
MPRARPVRRVAQQFEHPISRPHRMQPAIRLPVARRAKRMLHAIGIRDIQNPRPADPHVDRFALYVQRGQSRLVDDSEQVDHFLRAPLRPAEIAMIPFDRATLRVGHRGGRGRTVGDRPAVMHQVRARAVAQGRAHIDLRAGRLERGDESHRLLAERRSEIGKLGAVGIIGLVGVPPGGAAQLRSGGGRRRRRRDGSARDERLPGAAADVDLAVRRGGAEDHLLITGDGVCRIVADPSVFIENRQPHRADMGVEQMLDDGDVRLAVDPAFADRRADVRHGKIPPPGSL